MANDICYVCGTHNMRGSVCLTCCPDGDPRLKPVDTRPAAPVGGVSVAFYQVFLQGAWIDCPLSAYTVYSENGEETRKLCDQSQAEDIIAAERARYHALEEIAAGLVERTDKAEAANAALTAKLETANAIVTCCCGNPVDSHGIGDGNSPVDQYHYAMVQLEEQNAALTARVKEQIEHIATLDSNLEAMEKRAQEGETQLSAARKALEIMVQEYDKVDLLHDEPSSMTSAVLEARAALESKP